MNAICIYSYFFLLSNVVNAQSGNSSICLTVREYVCTFISVCTTFISEVISLCYCGYAGAEFGLLL